MTSDSIVRRGVTARAPLKAAVLVSWIATLAALRPAEIVAQASEPDAASIEALERLDFLLGEWTGTSTTRTGPGTESTSYVTERATLLAGGTAILLEGRGTIGEGGETRVVHEAVALITWDPEGERYEMRAFRAGQGWNDAELTLAGETLEWSLESPAGPIRFRLDFSSPGQWVETGEIRRNGEWFHFMDMGLERKG